MKEPQYKRFIDALVKEIPPPSSPIDKDIAATADLRTLPPDLPLFIQKYGTGHFTTGGEIFVSVYNPAHEGDLQQREELLAILRSYKAAEGDEYLPCEIFPESPGLLPWGWGDGRQQYCWYTKGRPAEWSVYTYFDMEIITKFKMCMVEFLEKLLCGKLDAACIGRPGRIDPMTVRFVPKDTRH